MDLKRKPFDLLLELPLGRSKRRTCKNPSTTSGLCTVDTNIGAGISLPARKCCCRPGQSLCVANGWNQRFGFTSDNIKVRAKMATTFTDHGMQVPQLLILKVANEIPIEIDLTFVKQ